jgi:spermidine dehydrogenase
VLAYYQARTHGEWGVGIDAVSALDLWGYGFPGFQGMNLSPGTTPRMSPTAAGYHETGGSVQLHFPDGNATIARLLVRKLIPGAAPGTTVEDVMTARFDYAQLDRPAAPVRVRLNSTVIRARHLGDPASASELEISYVRAGRPYTVRGRHGVLACWNMIIPYLCPELPPAQQAALHSLVKTPLIYANVALRNWRAFRSLGVSEVYAPGSYFSNLYLNPKVDIGVYRTCGDPEEATVLRMERTPCQPGLSEHDQNRAGRAELLGTSFATFEEKIRSQLTRTLEAGGFDAAREIESITVNRWPHGYAPEYNSLFEALLPLAQQPQVIGRARFHRIAIANSDSGAAAYTDAAIDQAHRAVGELLDG